MSRVVTGKVVIVSDSSEATQACGAALAPLLEAGDVLCLSGDLGAGKTQLTKGIARGLEVSEPVTSPTFNILLVHEGRIPLYHFDLYRLDDAEELEDIDYFGTLEADGVSVVEWGDKFDEALADTTLLVELRIQSDTGRSIHAAALTNRGAALLGGWAERCESIPDVHVGATG